MLIPAINEASVRAVLRWLDACPASELFDTVRELCMDWIARSQDPTVRDLRAAKDELLYLREFMKDRNADISRLHDQLAYQRNLGFYLTCALVGLALALGMAMMLLKKGNLL